MVAHATGPGLIPRGLPPRGETGQEFFLLGSNEPITMDPDAWRTRLLAPEVAARLAPERAQSVLNLLVKMRPFEDADPAPDEEILSP